MSAVTSRLADQLVAALRERRVGVERVQCQQQRQCQQQFGDEHVGAPAALIPLTPDRVGLKSKAEHEEEGRRDHRHPCREYAPRRGRRTLLAWRRIGCSTTFHVVPLSGYSSFRYMPCGVPSFRGQS